MHRVNRYSPLKVFPSDSSTEFQLRMELDPQNGRYAKIDEVLLSLAEVKSGLGRQKEKAEKIIDDFKKNVVRYKVTDYFANSWDSSCGMVDMGAKGREDRAKCIVDCDTGEWIRISAYEHCVLQLQILDPNYHLKSMTSMMSEMVECLQAIRRHLRC